MAVVIYNLSNWVLDSHYVGHTSQPSARYKRHLHNWALKLDANKANWYFNVLEVLPEDAKSHSKYAFLREQVWQDWAIQELGEESVISQKYVTKCYAKGEEHPVFGKKAKPFVLQASDGSLIHCNNCRHCSEITGLGNGRELAGNAVQTL